MVSGVSHRAVEAQEPFRLGHFSSNDGLLLGILVCDVDRLPKYQLINPHNLQPPVEEVCKPLT